MRAFQEERQSYEAAARFYSGESWRFRAVCASNRRTRARRAASLPSAALPATLAICGVEQLVARRAHNPEVAGSSPVPATSRRTPAARPGFCFGVFRFRPKAEMERLSGCEPQPSPNARETRPPDPVHEGASFAFGAAFREVGQGRRSPGVSGSSPRGRPAPPLADRMGRKSLIDLNFGSLAEQGAGLRLGRARWSGHYPKFEASGSAPLVRSRTVANCGARVMTPLTRSATARSEALGELRPCQKTHPILPRPAQSDWPSFGSSFLCPRSCGTSGIPLRPAHSRSLLLWSSWLRCLRGSCIGHGALGWLLFYCQCSPF